jgi:hypothetical protein
MVGYCYLVIRGRDSASRNPIIVGSGQFSDLVIYHRLTNIDIDELLRQEGFDGLV